MIKMRKMLGKIKHWYQAKIFPVLMDKNLGRKEIIQERINLLSYAKGEILELGIGTGNNLSYYPDNVKKITAIDSYVREIHDHRIKVTLWPYQCENMKFENGKNNL